jgi:hypothetical protein
VVAEQAHYLEWHQMEEAAHLDQVVAEHLAIAQVAPVVLALVDKDLQAAVMPHLVEQVEILMEQVVAVLDQLAAMLLNMLGAMEEQALLTQSAVEASIMLAVVVVVMLIIQLAVQLDLLSQVVD